MPWLLKSCTRCGGDINTTDEPFCIQCGARSVMRTYAPMLAQLGLEPFDDEKYIFEPKYDGIRVIYYYDGNTRRLINRSGRDVTSKFPEIKLELDHPCVLDGEAYCLGAQGRPDFQLMQTRMNRVKDVFKHSESCPAKFTAFDLLEFKGIPVIDLPLSQRKQHLKDYISPEYTSPYLPTYGIELFKMLSEKGWEGVMAKTLDGTYSPGKRVAYWKKIKARKFIEANIIGCTFGYGRRKETFGALVIANDANEFIGEVGTGFTDDETIMLLAKMRAQRAKACSANNIPNTLYQKLWTNPIRIKVSYLEVTSNNILRHPSFEGFVNDTL
jgi:bifunctional non-homologous end joining protein LigD